MLKLEWRDPSLWNCLVQFRPEHVGIRPLKTAWEITHCCFVISGSLKSFAAFGVVVFAVFAVAVLIVAADWVFDVGDF